MTTYRKKTSSILQWSHDNATYWQQNHEQIETEEMNSQY